MMERALSEVSPRGASPPPARSLYAALRLFRKKEAGEETFRRGEIGHGREHASSYLGPPGGPRCRAKLMPGRMPVSFPVPYLRMFRIKGNCKKKLSLWRVFKNVLT